MYRRFISNINKFPIIVTKNAWYKMTEIIKNKKGTSFLFAAKGGGCNGFNYDLKLLYKDEYDVLVNDKIKPTIMTFDKSKILIDPLSEMILLGTTIDYISEDYDKNIFENKFVFITDKNLASSCGCGISFTPK